MIRTVSRFIPYEIRRRIRHRLASMLGETVAQGYENYARRFKPKPNKYLGDEWNEPEVIGIDVSPDQIVPTLDRVVFQPFLGTCDTILAYAQKNLALRQLGMKEEPEDLAPDIPDQSEQPQKGIPGKPSGNLKEVPPPKAASKSPVRKDRTGGDFTRMPMVPVESQLKILEEQRAKILADTTYTEDERKRRLSQIASDIKAAAARKF